MGPLFRVIEEKTKFRSAHKLVKDHPVDKWWAKFEPVPASEVIAWRQPTTVIQDVYN